MAKFLDITGLAYFRDKIRMWLGFSNSNVLSIAHGGTGSANAAAARSALGITAGNIGAAPTNHASTGTGYGVGNGSNYGHLKLSDSTTSASGVGGGTAATPAAVKAVRDSLSQTNGTRVSTGITGVTGYRFGNYLLLQIERTGVNVSAGQATTLGTLPSNLRGSKGIAAATTSLGKVGARIFVETDGRVGVAASSAATISGDNVYGQVISLLGAVM